MTPKQLEKKAKQLLHRRKLAETIEDLQEIIKMVTANFIIRLERNQLSLTLLPRVDPRQLKLKFEENL